MFGILDLGAPIKRPGHAAGGPVLWVLVFLTGVYGGDVSYDDTARIMSEVLGRTIRYRQVPADAFTAMLVQNGMTQEWVGRLVELMSRVDGGLYNAQPRTAQSTTPTNFRQWCDDVLKPALAG